MNAIASGFVNQHFSPPIFQATINSDMEQLQLRDQVIRFDKDRTRRAYSSMKGGDAERCGCSYCRNFATQRSTAYPEVFRSLLDQLGIDAEKEGEVYESGPEGSLRMYGGWLYFAGEFVRAGERMSDTGSGFQYWFADAKNLPKPEADFGPIVLAVEFWTRLPWVIPDQPYSTLSRSPDRPSTTAA